MTQQTITSGPTPTSSSFNSFILAQLNYAALRSKIITNQIESATVALAGGMITAEQAILILHETGLEIGAE